MSNQSQTLILKRRKELLGKVQSKIRLLEAAFDTNTNEEAAEQVRAFQDMKKDILKGKYDKGINLMKCCYCGREIETYPCYDCFPLYRCKKCGHTSSTIAMSHKKPDGSWCDNPVRGFGDTRSDEYWLLINEDNYSQEGLRKFGRSHEVRAKVRFFGDDIGFQFSQTCNGSSSRKAKIIDIHKASEQDKAEIGEAIHSDQQCHKAGSKGTKRRLFDLDSEDFILLVGHSSFRFEGEDPRLVKVACVRYQKTPLEQCRWESYKPIYEDEELKDYEKEYGDYTK